MTPFQRAPEPVPEQEDDDDQLFVDASMEKPVEHSPPALRHSTHTRKPNPRYAQHGAVVVQSYFAAMISALMLTSGKTYDSRYLLNVLSDHNFGLYDNLGANT